MNTQYYNFIPFKSNNICYDKTLFNTITEEGYNGSDHPLVLSFLFNDSFITNYKNKNDDKFDLSRVLNSLKANNVELLAATFNVQYIGDIYGKCSIPLNRITKTDLQNDSKNKTKKNMNIITILMENKVPVIFLQEVSYYLLELIKTKINELSILEKKIEYICVFHNRKWTNGTKVFDSIATIANRNFMLSIDSMRNLPSECPPREYSIYSVTLIFNSFDYDFENPDLKLIPIKNKDIKPKNIVNICNLKETIDKSNVNTISNDRHHITEINNKLYVNVHYDLGDRNIKQDNSDKFYDNIDKLGTMDDQFYITLINILKKKIVQTPSDTTKITLDDLPSEIIIGGDFNSNLRNEIGRYRRTYQLYNKEFPYLLRWYDYSTTGKNITFEYALPNTETTSSINKTPFISAYRFEKVLESLYDCKSYTIHDLADCKYLEKYLESDDRILFFTRKKFDDCQDDLSIENKINFLINEDDKTFIKEIHQILVDILRNITKKIGTPPYFTIDKKTNTEINKLLKKLKKYTNSILNIEKLCLGKDFCNKFKEFIININAIENITDIYINQVKQYLSIIIPVYPDVHANSIDNIILYNDILKPYLIYYCIHYLLNLLKKTLHNKINFELKEFILIEKLEYYENYLVNLIYTSTKSAYNSHTTFNNLITLFLSEIIKQQDLLNTYYVDVPKVQETRISYFVECYKKITTILNHTILTTHLTICDLNPFKSDMTNKYMKYKLKYINIKKKK